MNQSTASGTWSFGSFVCVPGVPRIFADDADHIIEPSVPGRIIVGRPAADGWCVASDFGYFDADCDLNFLPKAAGQRGARRRMS